MYTYVYVCILMLRQLGNNRLCTFEWKICGANQQLPRSSDRVYHHRNAVYITKFLWNLHITTPQECIKIEILIV